MVEAESSSPAPAPVSVLLRVTLLTLPCSSPPNIFHFVLDIFIDIFVFSRSDLYDVAVEVPGYGGGGAGGVGGAGGLQGGAEAVGGRHAPNVWAGGAGQ